jgi:hypothetical protein
MSGEPSAPHQDRSTGDVEQARQADVSLPFAATGLLVAVTVALVFPLLWPRASLPWHLLAACVAALLPLGALGAWAAPPEQAAPDVHRGLFWLLPVLALGLSLLAYGWHHPRLWAINLTAEPLRLLVDGEPEVSLEPAGVDAARVAVELRLPRGEHELTALDARNQVVATLRARLSSGRDHLYAPASNERCFWLELTRYGRDATQVIVPLVSEARFFALDSDVDAWFAESPEPPGSDRRSSGGTLTVLRQSPCARAPEAVRRAASAVRP